MSSINWPFGTVWQNNIRFTHWNYSRKYFSGNRKLLQTTRFVNVGQKIVYNLIWCTIMVGKKSSYKSNCSSVANVDILLHSNIAFHCSRIWIMQGILSTMTWSLQICKRNRNQTIYSTEKNQFKKYPEPHNFKMCWSSRSSTNNCQSEAQLAFPSQHLNV